MSCFTKEEKLLVVGASLAATGAIAVIFTRMFSVALWLPLTITAAPLTALISVMARRRRMRELSAAMATAISAFVASPSIVAAALSVAEAVKSGGFSYVTARNLYENLGEAFRLVALVISASVFLAALAAFSAALMSPVIGDVDARLLADRVMHVSRKSRRWSAAGLLLGFSLPLVASMKLAPGLNAAQLYAYLALPAALLSSPISVSLSFLVFTLVPLQNGFLLGAALGCTLYSLANRAQSPRRAEAEGYGGLFQLSLSALVLILILFTLTGPAFPPYLLLLLLLSIVSSSAATSLEGSSFSLSTALLALLAQRLTAEIDSLLNLQVSLSWLAPFVFLASLAALTQLHVRVLPRGAEDCDPGMLAVAAPVAIGLLAIPYYAAGQPWSLPTPKRYEVSLIAVLLSLLLSLGGLSAHVLARSMTGSTVSLLAAAVPLHPSGMLLAALLSDYLPDKALLGIAVSSLGLKLLLTRISPETVSDFTGGVSVGAGLSLLALHFYASLK